MSWILQKHQSLELFAMIAWLIWTQGNQVRMNKPSCNAKDRFEEFSLVQPPKQPRVPKPLNLWQSPPPDLFKINFDGVVFSHENKSNIGVVIHNNQVSSLPLYLNNSLKLSKLRGLKL